MRALPLLLTLASCRPESFHHDATVVRIDAAVDAAIDAGVDPIGCSDGQREGLADIAADPTIAACAASWSVALDLRATATGVACGDDLGSCAVPADACSPGWHVCGSSGDITELDAITGDTCAALAGSYVAAISHCSTDTPACKYPNNGAWQCVAGTDVDCTQPACCGAGCDASNTCNNGIWPGETRENAPDGKVCANTLGTTQDGVLCCRS